MGPPDPASSAGQPDRGRRPSGRCRRAADASPPSRSDGSTDWTPAATTVQAVRPDELLARLCALVRRAGTTADSYDPSAQALTFSDLSRNTLTREVLRGTRAINVTRTEFALEALLTTHAGCESGPGPLDEVWGIDFPWHRQLPRGLHPLSATQS
jgi:hypothetical protein